MLIAGELSVGGGLQAAHVIEGQLAPLPLGESYQACKQEALITTLVFTRLVTG